MTTYYTELRYEGTDELCVEFYTHRKCGFERVPRLIHDSYALEYGNERTMSARFCPGCGELLDWVGVIRQ